MSIWSYWSAFKEDTPLLLKDGEVIFQIFLYFKWWLVMLLDQQLFLKSLLLEKLQILLYGIKNQYYCKLERISPETWKQNSAGDFMFRNMLQRLKSIICSHFMGCDTCIDLDSFRFCQSKQNMRHLNLYADLPSAVSKVPCFHKIMHEKWEKGRNHCIFY